jgi:ABC-type multidrug transport system ATPase subunit
MLFQDILAGRNKTGSIYGKIMYNGKPRNASFHRISGYVMQDDLLMATMTVREVLNFVAELRLPELVAKQEKQKRIDNAMEVLGIKHLADRRIGGTLKRGISGGEKKRVSIACELIASPNILFLDEPTSGLDSYNAYNVMSCLSRISKKGTTVIFSIHQPRSSVFDLFDYLLVLAEGHLTYFGKTEDVLQHFISLGYKVPDEYNIP